jgi:hypothetical protein
MLFMLTTAKTTLQTLGLTTNQNMTHRGIDLGRSNHSKPHLTPLTQVHRTPQEKMDKTCARIVNLITKLPLKYLWASAKMRDKLSTGVAGFA